MNETYLKTKKILLVDDEKDMIDMLISILNDDGFSNVITANCLKNALEIAMTQKPDLAILDIMLPDGNGFELMEEIKVLKDIPIIFLTAKDAIQDKYSGFGLGADDYITKPFLPKELLYRLKAVLRRTYKLDNPKITLSHCSIDLYKSEVIKNGENIPLTAKEHDILETLSKNANRIITIDMLCEAVWGDNPFGYENSLLAHIRRIREKIEENPSKPKSLITVKGLGYKLMIDERD